MKVGPADEPGLVVNVSSGSFFPANHHIVVIPTYNGTSRHNPTPDIGQIDGFSSHRCTFFGWHGL